MKRLLIAGIALLTVPSVFGQKEKEKTKTEGQESTKNSVQTIVITRRGNTDEKTVVEIDGDKVKVNGKDSKDNKDVTVRVNTMKGVTAMRGVGNNFVWNDGNGFSIFSEDENRAMLGVSTEGDDHGAEIESVTSESAAEKAGLKKGDIITRIDDKKIESSDDVTEAVRSHKPGDKITITYLRDGKEQKTTTELTKWKGVRINTINAPRLENLDRQMESMNRQFRQMDPGGTFMYGVPFGRPRLGLSIQDTDDGVGVKVLDVDEESAAAKAGIKKDDIIVGVDDTDVKGTEDVIKATRKEDKSSFQFKVKRGGSTQTIEVKLPRKLKTADL